MFERKHFIWLVNPFHQQKKHRLEVRLSKMSYKKPNSWTTQSKTHNIIQILLFLGICNTLFLLLHRASPPGLVPSVKICMLEIRDNSTSKWLSPSRNRYLMFDKFYSHPKYTNVTEWKSTIFPFQLYNHISIKWNKEKILQKTSSSSQRKCFVVICVNWTFIMKTVDF